MGPYIETRCTENTRRLCPYQEDKSAVAECSIALGHRIKLRGPEVKARTAGYMDQLVKETTEVQLHSNNIS
jgi:hypothetical protein